MVERKSVEEVEKNRVDGGAKLLAEFESLADLGIKNPHQVACIHFPEKDRYGFYLLSGKKQKSFSVPTAFIDKSRVLSQQVLEHIKSSGLYFEHQAGGSMKIPVLARSTSSVLKNFQGSQYPVVSSYAKYFSETFSEEQRQLLSRWFLQEGFYEEGVEKLDLDLNTDTNYFREKADKLAALAGGGSWSFEELNYHESGAKCTLGHDIKWEFIAKEQTTGEVLRFGVDCVQDFFNIEGQVQNQLVRFRTRYFNEMLTYAYGYSQQLGYQKNLAYGLLALLEYLFENTLAKPTSKLNYLLGFVRKFSALQLPLPFSLRLQILKELEEQRAYNLRYRLMDRTFEGVSLYNLYCLLGDLVPNVETYDKNLGAWSSVKSSLVTEHGLLVPEKDLVVRFLEHGFSQSVGILVRMKTRFDSLVLPSLASTTTENGFKLTYSKFAWFTGVQNNKDSSIPKFLGGILDTDINYPLKFGLGSALMATKELDVSQKYIHRYYEGLFTQAVSLENLETVYKQMVEKLNAQEK